MTLPRIFCTVFLILGVFHVGHAQIYVGLQAGTNLSTMDFSNNVQYRFTQINYEEGFTGGLVFQFLGSKHAGVQIEANYSQRGWQEVDTLTMRNLKTTNNMDYIEVPMLSHINIGGGKLRGLFHLGPYLGYALSRRITVKDETTGSSTTEEHEFNSDRDNRFDFGLMTAGGIEYRFPFGKLAAEARYTIGLGDIDKVKATQSEVSQFRIIHVLFRFTMPINRRSDDE